MAENSGIEWTDHTFNPWWGCTKIAPACDDCYAAKLATGRFGQPELWSGSRRRIKDWKGPRKWNRNAAVFMAQQGRRQRVFTASMADIFDNQVDTTWRDDFWMLVRECPELDWLLLTKRPQNIAKMLPEFWDEIKGTVWLGTTVEDEKRAALNIPHLLQHDSAVRFLSMEPLIEQVDIVEIATMHFRGAELLYPLSGELADIFGESVGCTNRIDWVITGGESGGTDRTAHAAPWYRSLRDQCATAGVPFHFKQWGDYDEHGVKRGKKKTGRTLDGVTHDGFPVQPEGEE